MADSESPKSKRRMTDALLVILIAGAVVVWWLNQRGAIEKLEDRSDIYYHYAMLAELQGLRDEAKQQLAQALNQNPNHRLANYLTGYILAKESQNLSAAESHIIKAKDLDPTDWIAYEAMGLIHYKRGDFAKAAAEYQQGLSQKRGKNIYLYDRLGDAQWSLGEKEKAVAAWQFALDPPPWEAWEQPTEAETSNQEAGDVIYNIGQLFEAREQRIADAVNAKLDAVHAGEEPTVDQTAVEVAP